MRVLALLSFVRVSPELIVMLLHSQVDVFTITVPSIITLSATVGTAPPIHVVVSLQLPPVVVETISPPDNATSKTS